MAIKVTVLGCAGSFGVPAPGIGWGLCDPSEPKNRRSRASILIQQDDFNLLIDSGPDLRHQLLTHNINKIDAVICTHAHADHILGTDDLRPLMYANQTCIPYYATRKTFVALHQKMGYLFQKETDLPQNRPYELEPRELDRIGPLTIGPMHVQLFEQSHGYDISLGIRIGLFAYSTDLNALNDAAIDILRGVDTWIVDCNNRTMDDSFKHSDLQQVISWRELIKPRQIYLTHLPAWHDYKELKSKCPDGVEPAFDGLQVIVKA